MLVVSDGVVILDVAVSVPAVSVFTSVVDAKRSDAVVEVDWKDATFSEPFVRARVKPARFNAVVFDNDPPRVKTLVEVEKTTPFVPVEVDSCEAVVRHVPDTEKHPLVRAIPFPKVDEPVIEVMFNVPADILAADRPPAKVDVPCPAPTVRAEAKVDVAVDVAIREPRIVCPYNVLLASVLCVFEVSREVVILDVAVRVPAVSVLVSVVVA